MTALARFEFGGPARTLVGWSDGTGDATPAVFVHGINGSGEDWHPVMRLLASGRRVLTLDLRGHGASVQLGPFAAEDYAGDVLALLDHEGIRTAHVVGTSYGGAVAVTLAVRAPERARSIAAFGAALNTEGGDLDAAAAAMRELGAYDFFRTVLTQVGFAPGTDPQLVDAVAGRAAHRDLEVIAAVTRTAFADDLSSRAAEVTVPALVATGELDLTCPVPVGARLATALGTPHTVIPGRGHLAMLEDPHAVAALVSTHLAASD